MKTYRRKRLCPKCRVMPGMTTYYPGHHYSETCPLTKDISNRIAFSSQLWGGYGYWDADTKARKEKVQADLFAERDAVPEHFDRECPNCKYVWVEAVV